ncbi:MAG: uridine kinase [Bacteroidetes bacterium]|nr:uridine kinase [Bacteroidota bacterium]
MKPILIGIAGGTGSGKTTVTRKLIEHLHFKDVIILQHDSYYKDLSSFRSNRITEINFDHPNSLDTALLVRHLKKLKSSQPIQKPLYDFTTYRRLKDKELIQPGKVVILEGILIFVDKALRDLMDIKIFVDTDADERLLRRLKRDITERGRSFDSVMTQYINTVKPMHLEFVEPSKRWADVIIPKGGENEVAIGMLASRVRSLINEDK